MKTVLYFVLSLLTIVYVGILCYLNICPDAVTTGTVIGEILKYVQLYGGVVLVFVFAFVNFFGSPLKAVFFTILIVVAIAFIVTAIIPQFITIPKIS